MSDVIIRTSGLCRSFTAPSGDTLDVVKDVDFLLRRGETVSIVGSSGAGKTTLLHLLGLIDTPTAGKIEYFDDDPFGMSDDGRASFRNRNIGFIFQMHYLLPEFSALENVLMPILIRRGDVEAARARAVELFEHVGLGQRLHHKPGQLSGGEQQRVSLVRAFIGEPALILADEPTGNLDRRNAASIIDLFMSLNATTGTSIVLVTHNEELARSTSRCCRMDDGRLVEL